ncbi:MAG: PEP-CTERM sorting domain-containing protein [Gemmatimonadaceae bacterium]|nr:PEP-CTERM sorting domain-containing protein [Gemmatimonadaceae bacterium]
MKNLLRLCTAAALLSAPVAVDAQLTLPTNVANTSVVASIGPWAISHSFTGAPGNELVGPFAMTFSLFGSAIEPIVCVDFSNAFANGQSYNANLTLLSSTTADLAIFTRQGQALGGAAGFTRYLQMAWLADRFATSATSEWAGIQGAIWNLESAGTPDAASNPGVQFWLNQLAAADLSTVELSKWAVVTDVTTRNGVGGSQEFLVRANVVPEPSTYVLMLTGFAGLVLVSRRRRAV